MLVHACVITERQHVKAIFLYCAGACDSTDAVLSPFTVNDLNEFSDLQTWKRHPQAQVAKEC